MGESKKDELYDRQLHNISNNDYNASYEDCNKHEYQEQQNRNTFDKHKNNINDDITSSLK